jgi:hypothetical protein
VIDFRKIYKIFLIKSSIVTFAPLVALCINSNQRSEIFEILEISEGLPPDLTQILLILFTS